MIGRNLYKAADIQLSDVLIWRKVFKLIESFGVGEGTETCVRGLRKA